MVLAEIDCGRVYLHNLGERYMNPKTKRILRTVSLHALMVLSVGLVWLGTFLRFGYEVGLIALGVGMGIYAYLLGAD